MTPQEKNATMKTAIAQAIKVMGDRFDRRNRMSYELSRS